MNIEIKNVAKSFDKVVVLKDVDLKLNSGNWLSIIGTSGAGKTTILNLIAGLLISDEGEIIIGKYSNKMKRRGLVGYLLQDFPLYPSLSVRDNLKHAEKKRFKAEGPTFQEVVEKFKIERYLNHLPSMLSGGEKQRVALARTLLLHRPVLLLDEPFSNIDVVMRRDLRRYCRMIQKDWSYTVILVTHDQEDTMSTSDLVAFLDEGKIVQLDIPERMFRSPASKSVGDNFGDVGMVWLPTNLLSQDCSFSILERNNERFCGLRESDFEVVKTPRKEFWNVKVLKKEYLGSRYRYFVEYRDLIFSIVSSVNIQKSDKCLWIFPSISGSNYL